jgi:hypothetical protein
MWVLLDHVGEDGGWSGTLNNHPFVPGPLDCGTRVWLRSDHLLAHRPRARPAPTNGPFARVLRRLVPARLRRGR